MATYNVLSWQNENALSSYPFERDTDIQDFIVDARFVQFDGFIPILNSVQVESDSILLTVTTDAGELSNIVLARSDYDTTISKRRVRLYTVSGDRYLGVIVFGPGTNTVWSNYVGRKLEYNINFLAETVRSIPSKDAVYTLDGNYGDITLSRDESDSTIFYNVSTTYNSITFNAVAGHSVDLNAPRGLRKINLVRPSNNNINLASNDIIKFDSLNNSFLTISLVSGAQSSSFAIPSLTS